MSPTTISRGPVLRRRLADSLATYRFAEIQLALMHEQAGPHHLRNVGFRIAALHRRLDTMEDLLRREARARGLDARLPMSELVRRLDSKVERRRPGDAHTVAERRLWVRRVGDRAALEAASASLAPRAEDMLRALQRAGEAVFVAAASWRCIAANPLAAGLLGYTPRELHGRQLYDLIAGGDWSAQSSLPGDLAWPWQGQLTLRRRDGAQVVLDARARTVRLSGGMVRLLVGRPLTM